MGPRLRKASILTFRLAATSAFVLALFAIDFENPKDILSATTLKRLSDPATLSGVIHGNMAKVGRLLETTNRGLLLLAFVLHLGCIGLLAWRWSLLLQVQGMRFRFHKLYAYYLIGFFFNNFLPTNIGGDVARVYATGAREDRLTQSFAVVFIERFIGFVAVFLLAAAAIFFQANWFRDTPSLYAILLFGLAIVLVSMVLFSSSLRYFLRKMIARLGWVRLNEGMTKLFEAMHLFRGHTATLGTVFLVSLTYQAALVAVNAIAALAVGVRPPVLALFFVIQMTTLLCLVPISINGLGIREGFYIGYLSTVGVARESTLAFQVILLAVNYVESLMGGLCFLLRKKLGEPKEILAKDDEPLSPA